jgi:hypothetical protein
VGGGRLAAATSSAVDVNTNRVKCMKYLKHLIAKRLDSS